MSTWIGYTGALAYMLEHQVSAVYTDDIALRLQRQWEEQRRIEDLSPEERCQLLREQQYASNSDMIRAAFDAAIAEEQYGPETFGSGFG
jgi:hypothetical protein